MFGKNISVIFRGFEFLERPPFPVWQNYTDQSGTEHVRIGGRYWDEAQIKAPAAGDYEQHIIFNAYQNHESLPKVTVRTKAFDVFDKPLEFDKYPLTNVIRYDALGALQELEYLTNNLAECQRGFQPEFILTNLYGLQNWTNMHAHFFAGEHLSQYWTVLDDLRVAANTNRFSGDSLFLRDYQHFAFVQGTRNTLEEETVVAVNLTSCIRYYGHDGLSSAVKNLTQILQPSLMDMQRRLPAAAGFRGYGSLVFFLRENTFDRSEVFYLLEDMREP